MRLLNFALPALVAAGAAIPTIPTFKPAGPPANGIVAAEDGTVYFVDSFHRTVWRLQPSGRMTAFVSGRNGRSLQIDAEGNIYGTHDEGRGHVSFWRADPAGTVLEVGRTVLPDLRGQAFVLDNGGEVIGFTGTTKRTGVHIWRSRDRERYLVAGGDWGLRDGVGSDARFLPIGGITRSPDGELYVTSGPTVRKVDQNGAVSTVAKGDLLAARTSLLSRIFGEVQGHLTGIAVDDDGTIYVTNPGRDAVVRVDSHGRTSEILTCDHGWSPTGVAVVDGVLYVLEYGPGVRVRRVVSDGAKSTIVATIRVDRVIATQAYGRGLTYSS